MFKYKLILLSITVLFSCGKTIEVKEEVKTKHYVEVINKTDSLLSYADGKIGRIRENNKQKMFVMDSLEQTIKQEQYLINKKVKRIEDIDANLQLTKKELELALSKCKIKEEILVKLGDSLIKIREKLTNEKIDLVNLYTSKIKSLEETIDLLNDKLSLVEVVKEESEPKDKKNKKRRKSEKNN